MGWESDSSGEACFASSEASQEEFASAADTETLFVLVDRAPFPYANHLNMMITWQSGGSRNWEIEAK